MKFLNFLNKTQWPLMYLLFAIDYFIVSPEDKKIQTCCFWMALVVFLIWLEIILMNNRNEKEKNRKQIL